MQIIKLKNEYYLSDGEINDPICSKELERYADANPWHFDNCIDQDSKDDEHGNEVFFSVWDLDQIVGQLNQESLLLLDFINSIIKSWVN